MQAVSAQLVHVPVGITAPKTFNDIDIKAVEPNPRALDLNPALEHSVYFVNGFPFDVKIVFRSGMSMIVQHRLDSYGSTGGRLVVRNSYTFRGGVKIDLNQLSGVMGGIPTKERQEILKAINYEPGLLDNGFRRVRVDYALEPDGLAQALGGIYIPELDIVVTRYTETPTYHPASPEGIVLARQEQQQGNEKFGYAVEIVDPNDECGPRYVNVNNTVHRVEPNKRVDTEPGVYITTATRNNLNTQYYSFAEAEEKKLIYRTRDEAEHFGDLAKEKEREFERLKMEHNILKQQYERTNLEAKDRYERRSMEQKDVYEERSYRRKDSSEAMKWLPSIIGATVVAAGLAAKVLMAPATSGLSFLWPF